MKHRRPALSIDLTALAAEGMARDRAQLLAGAYDYGPRQLHMGHPLPGSGGHGPPFGLRPATVWIISLDA